MNAKFVFLSNLLLYLSSFGLCLHSFLSRSSHLGLFAALASLRIRSEVQDGSRALKAPMHAPNPIMKFDRSSYSERHQWRGVAQ